MDQNDLVKNKEDRELVELLQKLIRIPSWVSLELNQNENEVVTFLEKWLKDNTNLVVERQKIKGGRYNLIAKKGEPRVIFLAHTDTVAPSQEAKIDQFSGEIKDGYIWGRGASDMKSGIAVIAQAASLDGRANNFWLIFYADEEYDFLGMKALVEKNSSLRPKLIVSADGSDMKIGHGCRGIVEIKAQLKGKSGHAAMGNGLNAIDGVFDGIRQLRKYLGRYSHPVMGRSSLNLAYLFGGTELPERNSLALGGELIKLGKEGNVIPDIAEFIIDVRPASPRITDKTLILFLENFFLKTGYKFKILQVRHNLGAWFTEQKDIKGVIQAAGKTLGAQKVAFENPGETGYIDLQMLWEKNGNPPAVTFGGGVGSTAHQPDERIKIDNLLKTRGFFSELLRKYCH